MTSWTLGEAPGLAGEAAGDATGPATGLTGVTGDGTVTGLFGALFTGAVPLHAPKSAVAARIELRTIDLLIVSPCALLGLKYAGSDPASRHSQPGDEECLSRTRGRSDPQFESEGDVTCHSTSTLREVERSSARNLQVNCRICDRRRFLRRLRLGSNNPRGNLLDKNGCRPTPLASLSPPSRQMRPLRALTQF